MISRRSLIQLMALSPFAAGLAGAVGARAQSGSSSSTSLAGWRKKLVLVELQGGNDGLNTVIPIDDPLYRRLRPKLAIDKSEALGLGGGLALHPNLAKLMEIIQVGDGAVILGVGYPHPVRSHFRSADIWHTGSGADDNVSEGWAARIAGRVAEERGLRARGLVIAGDAGPLDGAGFAALAADDDKTSKRTERPASNAALAHLAHVHEEVRTSHADIDAVVDGGLSPQALQGKAFVEQCRVAARALAKLDVAVVKLTLRGFDTHVNERDQHGRLMTELAAGLAELRSGAKSMGVWSNTLVATTSEFGRRAKENASGGTDHGTAAPMFLLGGALKSGLHGTQPALGDLDGEGDVRFSTDYRAVLGGLATAAWDVPRADAKSALGGVEPLVLV